MSIVFKNAFYYFDKDEYYDKVLNRTGISKKIDTNLITKFFRDILKQYNNLYSIASSIEKYLNSKRNEKPFSNYKKSLLMIEENFRFIEEYKIFEHVFASEVLSGNNNSNGRTGLRYIYDYFHNIKEFIDKIDKHGVEDLYNLNQIYLVVFYIVFEYHSKQDEIKLLTMELPKIKEEIKSFINNFSKQFKRASKDYKACQNYFKKNNPNKITKSKKEKFVRENVIFMLILTYENMYKCIQLIDDLCGNIKNILKIHTRQLQMNSIVKSVLKKSENKGELEKRIIDLLRTTTSTNIK